MSFQNFDSFQNQHPSADAAAAAAPGAPATADTTMTGQTDPTTGSFQGPAPGEPSAAPVAQQGNEGKTTLWYAWPRSSRSCTYSEIRVLFCWPSFRMGELEPWIDENFIRNLWFQMGEQVNVKMIRDKFSGWVYGNLLALLKAILMLVVGAMPDIASSTSLPLPLLPRPFLSTGPPCPTPTACSSWIGPLVAVLLIEGE